MQNILMYFLVGFASLLVAVEIGHCHKHFITYRAENDRIRSLPDVSDMPAFAMYSGYLNARGGKKLHYWLNMCEDVTSDTLIVWFNGGPGCSSMEGLFVENGPFKLDGTTGRPVRNDYSWNKLAHTLYIESPVGVGFSYGGQHEPLDDDTVAQDAMYAFMDFFEKFGSLSDCDIYISGESYAGVYIPTLVTTILDFHPRLGDRIQGLLIGNGLLHASLNEQSLVYFAYYHGLVDEKVWNEILENCCDQTKCQRCDFYKFKNEKCMLQVMRVTQIVTNEGLNMYNLYQDCTPAEQRLQQYYFKEAFIENLPAKFREYLKSALSLVPPCSNSTILTTYLNRADVQRAIHVRSTTWEICSTPVHSDYNKIHQDMTPYLRRILNEMDARVLLYFGDVDMACNHLGGEWFTNNLNFKETMPRRTWSISRGGTDQIAGFVKEMDKLTFATIKGAGHMVPSDKPQAAYEMVRKFLDYEPL